MEFDNTISYWNRRYFTGMDSGAGSYGRLAEFKAGVINTFIKSNGITTMLDLGCGDGNQLSMFEIDNYTGVDVSPHIIHELQHKYTDDEYKVFRHVVTEPAELVISLDVIYHLVEQGIYEDYMSSLFMWADKFVIIYSSDGAKVANPCGHIVERKFTNWVDDNEPGWELFHKIDNPYPYDPASPQDTSVSDFYFFRRK